jgi:glycosyltransferase involved in cell wall biosynthesis
MNAHGTVVLKQSFSDSILRGKTILFVVNEGGFFLSHRKALGVAAQHAGARVVIAAPSDGSFKEIQAAGFECIPITLRRWGMNPLREIGAIYDLIKTYRQLQPDIVHHVTIKPVIYGSIAAKIAKIPHIVNAVSGLGYVFLSKGFTAYVRRYLVRALYVLALRKTKVIFQNPDDECAFVDEKLVRKSQSILIRGSGVNLEAFPFIPEPIVAKPMVLLPGRILRAKGIKEFVQMVAYLRAEGVNAKYVVAGEHPIGNPDAVRLEDLALWSRAQAIEICGYVADIQKLYAKAAVVCLPSYREGLPRALLEAAATGRALVAFDVPGCREIVCNNYNGFTVPLGDVEGLAQRVKVLLEKPVLRQELGKNSRRLVEENFSEESVVTSTLAVYQEFFNDSAR